VQKEKELKTEQEREVNDRDTKIRKEEAAKYNEALIEKDRQIEAAKLERTINIEDKIRQAVTEKETRYRLHIQRLEKR